MIPWMLGRLEQSPHAVFSEREPKQRFPEEFEEANRERLIRRVTSPPAIGATGTYAHKSGQTYVVVPVEGGYEAFDPEDPEVDPIPVATADLVQWALDLSAFSERIQNANGLSGQPGPLNGRLYFAGEREEEGSKTAWIMALLPSENIAMDVLSSLPGLLPGGFRRRIVLCPTFQPSLDARLRLQGFGLEMGTVEFPTPDSPIPVEASSHEAVDLEFQHWDDYRQVRWRGQLIVLDPLQAEVVRVLHSVLNGGSPGLTWEAISRRIPGNAGSMNDIFKNSDPRKQLIDYQMKVRLYRLNI